MSSLLTVGKILIIFVSIGVGAVVAENSTLAQGWLAGSGFALVAYGYRWLCLFPFEENP